MTAEAVSMETARAVGPAAKTPAQPDEELALVMPPHSERLSCARVDWRELRAIATQVQRDLDAHYEIDDHEDYENVFAMWCAELGDADNRTEAEAEVEADSVETAGSDHSAAQQGAQGDTPSQLTWYASAHKYWDDEGNCPLSDDGVLGGFGHVSGVDIRESRRFLKHVQSTKRPEWCCDAAVDCGAGIGRVSKQLLLPLFQRVDLVEQSPRLLRGLPTYLNQDKTLEDAQQLRERVGELYCMGLQDFAPSAASYDLIWMQWVLVHLTDLDCVRFLQRCKQALRPHGFLVVKENVFLRGEPYDLDRDDSSITRSAVYYKSLFRQAGLELLAEKRQRHFPEELYPVKMYALA